MTFLLAIARLISRARTRTQQRPPHGAVTTHERGDEL